MIGNIYNKIREATGIPGLEMEEIESSGIMEDYIEASKIKVDPEYIALSRFYELVGKDEVNYPLNLYYLSPVSLDNFISDLNIKNLLQKDNSFLEHILAISENISRSTINTIIDIYGKDNFITNYKSTTDPDTVRILNNILNPNDIPKHLRSDWKINNEHEWLYMEPRHWRYSIRYNILSHEVLNYVIKSPLKIDLLIWYKHNIPEEIIDQWISEGLINNIDNSSCYYLRGGQKVSIKILEKHWDMFNKILNDVLNGSYIELNDEFIEEKIYRPYPYQLGNIIKSGRPGEIFIESHWNELKRPDVIKNCISECTLSEEFLEQHWNEIKKKIRKIDVGWKTKIKTKFINEHWKDLNTKFITKHYYNYNIINKNQKRIEEFKKTIIESYF